jgi:hypothetical protein
MSNIDFNALGQVIDTTWGRSSTPNTSGYSVKISMLNADMMLVTFQTYVNISSFHDHAVAKKKAKSEAEVVLSATLKSIKKRYKDLTGKSLSLKLVNSEDGFDMVNMTVFSATRQALFRSKMSVEIS